MSSDPADRGNQFIVGGKKEIGKSYHGLTMGYAYGNLTKEEKKKLNLPIVKGSRYTDEEYAVISGWFNNTYGNDPVAAKALVKKSFYENPWKQYNVDEVKDPAVAATKYDATINTSWDIGSDHSTLKTA